MKNVEIFNRKMPVFRVPIQGMPPLSGWAVRYISGMEGTPDIEPGIGSVNGISVPKMSFLTLSTDCTCALTRRQTRHGLPSIS